MRKPIVIRCSSIGKLMTEPKSIDPRLITEDIAPIVARTKRTDEEKALLAGLKEQTLSETAKTHIRELVSQDLFGVDFEIGSKPIAKGQECEQDGIDLLNRLRGLALVKNAERRDNGYISGECDLFDALRAAGEDAAVRGVGHDIKCPWSIQTFPIVICEAENALYWWQMQGYMILWGAARWEVNYALVNTPAHLIGYESEALHNVDHIPERFRMTTWVVDRDPTVEARIVAKVQAARAYYAEVVEEFDRLHADPMLALPAPVAKLALPVPAPAPAPAVLPPKAAANDPSATQPAAPLALDPFAA